MIHQVRLRTRAQFNPSRPQTFSVGRGQTKEYYQEKRHRWLISCPECNSQVSDRAASCPKCGYPLGQEKSFAHLLVDCRWKARSSALAAESLEANFASDGSFE